jgi:hypothetical protein
MATGPLSQPRMPDGVDTSGFKGTQFHSSHWQHDVTLGTLTRRATLRGTFRLTSPCAPVRE